MTFKNELRHYLHERERERERERGGRTTRGKAWILVPTKVGQLIPEETI